MLKTLLTAFFAILLVSRLNAQTSVVDSSEMRTLRIDPGNARGAAVSQLFDEVEFIPLETTKESLFGSISQLEIAEDRFVVFDYDTKAVLIFDKDGKYKGKVNSSKIEEDKTEKESQNFYGFSIKKEDEKTFIRINAGKYYIYFDLDGKRVKKVLSKDIKSTNEKVFSDGTEVDRWHKVKIGQDSTFYEISLIKDKKEIANYMPDSANRYKNDQFFSGGNSLIDYKVKDELFFLNFYDYNIYKITPKKLSLTYRIILPAGNSLPPDFKTNPVYKGKRQDYFSKNPAVIYALSNTYRIGDNLFLKTHSWSFSMDKKNSLIYNLKTNALTSISDIEADSLSNFLPITDAGFYYDFLNHGFHLYDGNYLYTSYSSLAMFGFKERNEERKLKYSALMEAYFKTENKKSNPVIVRLKPKKD